MMRIQTPPTVRRNIRTQRTTRSNLFILAQEIINQIIYLNYNTFCHKVPCCITFCVVFTTYALYCVYTSEVCAECVDIVRLRNDS